MVDGAGGDFVGGRQQGADRETCGVGRRALIATEVRRIGLGEIPDERAQRRDAGARRGRVVELVELLLVVGDDEKVAIALPRRLVARVAVEVGATFDVPVRRDRHLQGDGVAVRAAVAIRRAGERRDRASRRRRVAKEDRNREVDLQPPAAPAAHRREGLDDRIGAGVGGMCR
jgi:hypothetical protein